MTNAEWDKRFKEKGRLWGDEPSQTALESLDYIQQMKGGRLLDVGCGYGRDCKYFMGLRFDVTGIDVSAEAIKLAEESAPGAKYFVADATDIPLPDVSFNIIFSHLFLHLLYEDEKRTKFLDECMRLLRPGGLMLHSFFSTDDPTFGEGEEIAKNTFHVPDKGRTARFFSEGEVRTDFTGFKICELKKLEEYHTHGGPHTHVYWFVVAKK